MAELTMPKMGDAMEEGTVLRWLKSEGDSIQEEEPIAEIQTEKATIEVPSYEAGKLTRILVPEGQTVPVGTPIAQYEPEGGEREQPGAGNGASAGAATADREQVPGPSQPVPMTPPSPMRRTIAKRLAESKQTVPHFYVTMEIEMAAAARLREQLNALDSERPSISYNDLVVKACAGALQKFPVVNSQFTPEG